MELLLDVVEGILDVRQIRLVLFIQQLVRMFNVILQIHFLVLMDLFVHSPQCLIPEFVVLTLQMHQSMFVEANRPCLGQILVLPLIHALWDIPVGMGVAALAKVFAQLGHLLVE